VGGALGQAAPSLAQRIATPAFYLSIDAEVASGKVGGKAGLLTTLERSAPAALLRRLAAVEEGTAHLVNLERLARFATGTVEVAMLDAEEAPLVVQCAIAEENIATVADMLASGKWAQADGEVGKSPVYRLLRGGGDLGALSIALADRMLLVANQRSLLEELAAPAAGRPPRDALVDDPDYRALVDKVRGERGLRVFVSWPKLRRALDGNALTPAATALWQWSGAVPARAMLLAVSPRDDGLGATLLIQQGEGRARPDGWLALLDRAPAATLAVEMPRGGLGSLCLAVDPKAMRGGEAGPVLRALYTRLSGGCERVGLNLEQQVLQQLKGTAAVQIAVTAGDRLSPAYAFKAKSERAARRVYEDCRRVFVQHRTARVEGQAGAEELVLSVPVAGLDSLRFGVVADDLVLATDRDVTGRFAAAEQAGRDRVRPASSLLKRVSGAANQHVNGVFVLDFSAVIEQAAAPLARHAGVMRMFGDYVRVDVFSEL
jgi:hypothetical protein